MGNHKMVVSDDVSPGALIRGVATVSVSWGSYSMSSRTVPSNYVIVPYPEVTAQNVSLLNQPIMGLFTTLVTIRSSRDIVNGDFECYTPPEMISKEVRLTVQNMMVDTNGTHGMPSETLELLDSLQGGKMSSLGSYQNNIGILRLPRVPLANFTSEMVVTSTFTVRVEDYSELKDGDIWPINMGTNFHNNVMWVGMIQVTIDAPLVRLPVLLVSMQQSGQCAYDGR
ncbi:uncharacterized protein LOC131955653 [Physella acuta]|uniref:uncharacterized protein LOC131955653 n=1 Tax=Physella acuta TaxID=109671 RepID=UPI0027DE4992|nr:uncharacterized protein LOC131955653 [Physella acuta]